MTLNMNRPVRWFAALATVILLAGTITPNAQAQRPPAAELLPRNTLLMISIVDVPELTEKFMNTSIGRMSQDPQMKPLLTNLYDSLREAIAEAEEAIGMTLPEILEIPQGEITFALVPDEENQMVPVIMMDVGNRLSRAQKLLELGTGQLDRSGAKKDEQTVAGTKITTYTGGSVGNDGVSFFEKDATLVVSQRPETLTRILEAWDDEEAKTLSDNRDYAATMRRCGGTKDERPQIIAYVDPIGIAHATSQGNIGAQVALAMLPPLGLDGLSGIGASVIFDAGQFESVMHLHILLESPRSGIIKMIALKSGESKPERWVPGDVASYATLHWDFETTYDELKTVVDSFQFDGALAEQFQTVFDNVDLDFEEEVLPALDGRVTMISSFERPASLGSQNMLLAVKVKEDETAQKLLDKVKELAGDGLTEETFLGRKYLQAVMPEFPVRPDGSDPPQQPQPCIALIDGYLMGSLRPDLLRRVISTLSKGSATLADELDFKLIASKIQRQAGGDKPALVSFQRPEETLRFLYDLATAENTRAGLQRQAESNPVFGALNKALEENPLPPFSVIKRYVAPGGGMIVDDQTGFHYMAFSLSRETE